MIIPLNITRRYQILKWLNRLSADTRKSVLYLIVVFLLILILFFSIAKPHFNDPTCTVILANDGSLLAATIAADGQYRFPTTDSIPDKFVRCAIEFEDRYFFRHPGVNPFSIIRAAYHNIRAKRIVQGGSTITQQVIRLYRKGKSRSIQEKFIEAILAFRLEVAASKAEILSMYASNAPFGGNVVGLDAAAWRYYGRSAKELSWAESAALAVLPNAPALVFPGRNPNALLSKRNRLLYRLYKNGDMDSLTYSLSLLEPLPGEPLPLPQLAPHLLTRAITEGRSGQIIRSTISPRIQERVGDILERHHRELAGNQIHNGAVLVLDVVSNTVVAYVGNTSGVNNGNQVDIISSPRSTGSILKPFLYAAMLQDGLLLPHTLVPDIPTQIGSYSPKNYNPEFDGAVPASRAISRSLNIPAVRLLQKYGVERFHYILRKLGLSTITRTPENYGLSLILGGAEATLWDLAGVYAGMARTLNTYRQNQSRYFSNNYLSPSYTIGKNNIYSSKLVDHSLLDASAIYFCFEAMKEVSRPDESAGWQYFSSSRSVAWKTGTSFGHRDAWAIGLNPQYVVAVWVGNASGEGRPNLTGVTSAAPILFDVFGVLPPSPWFDKPTDDMAFVPICRYSGHRASTICTPVDSAWIPVKGLDTEPCPYHLLIHLNASKTHRITDKCVRISDIEIQPWFILPPAMEWYYRTKNPFYRQLPPFLKGCEPETDINPMALLYPRIEKATIFIPRDFEGNLTETIFEVAHRRENATIFWHLNEQYIGQTQTFHKMALRPSKGNHRLTLVDDLGNTQTLVFKIE